MELYPFLDAHRKDFAEFAPELNKVETEFQAMEMLRNPQFLTFGIRAEDGQLAAIATVKQESEEMVSLGFAVGADYRRQGFATDIVKTLAENLFKTPNIKKIRCEVKPKNLTSRRLLGNLGFHLAGEVPYKYVFYDLDKEESGA